MSLVREDLDQLAGAGCQVEGCDCKGHGELFFHARCNPSAGTRVSYKDGRLTIICKKCRLLVAEVEVASQAKVPAVLSESLQLLRDALPYLQAHSDEYHVPQELIDRIEQTTLKGDPE